MAVYKSELGEISDTWSAGITLDAATWFQNGGLERVRIASGAAPADPLDGISLGCHEGIKVEAGVTVYWRSESNARALLTSAASG